MPSQKPKAAIGKMAAFSTSAIPWRGLRAHGTTASKSFATGRNRWGRKKPWHG